MTSHQQFSLLTWHWLLSDLAWKNPKSWSTFSMTPPEEWTSLPSHPELRHSTLSGFQKEAQSQEGALAVWGSIDYAYNKGSSMGRHLLKYCKKNWWKRPMYKNAGFLEQIFYLGLKFAISRDREDLVLYFLRRQRELTLGHNCADFSGSLHPRHVHPEREAEIPCFDPRQKGAVAHNPNVLGVGWGGGWVNLDPLWRYCRGTSHTYGMIFNLNMVWWMA